MKPDHPKISPIQLYDIVTSKRTGLPMQGFVHGLITGQCYHNVIQQCRPSIRWDNLYPGWKRKLVCLIVFKVPQKSTSIEEIKESLNCDDHESERLFNELKSIPAAYYPIDDLEIVESLEDRYNNDLKNQENGKEKS
jgi:hypothetical protein